MQSLINKVKEKESECDIFFQPSKCAYLNWPTMIKDTVNQTQKIYINTKGFLVSCNMINHHRKLFDWQKSPVYETFLHPSRNFAFKTSKITNNTIYKQKLFIIKTLLFYISINFKNSPSFKQFPKQNCCYLELFILFIAFVILHV